MGHNPVIVKIGGLAVDYLRWAERSVTAKPASADVIGTFDGLRIGAQPSTTALQSAPASMPGRLVTVISSDQLRSALASAVPGDVITPLPGRYRLTGSYLKLDRSGTAAQPIVVRAEEPGTVHFDLEMVEGFWVTSPYWTFENLNITGVCATQGACEHAFHIVGNAHHFVARNNTIMDFNSHFKINGEDRVWPDDGLLEFNTIINNSVRQTANPVDVIDLVGASNWQIRKNFIADFFKGEGNRTSYGGFAKGAGSHNIFENNVVICEYRVRDPGAITVGLSLGGGGTGAPYCRDQRCVVEQANGSIRGNLIAACSHEGIYINHSAQSVLTHNTLIDTAGITVRFPSSSADVEGNLVDGLIRTRDGALLRSVDNRDTSAIALFSGLHLVRDLMDFGAKPLSNKTLPKRNVSGSTAPVPDLCGTSQGAARAYGAFERFAECRR